MNTGNRARRTSFLRGESLCTTAMHSMTARFLRAGDRFEWRGEILTADDEPIEHDGIVTVPLALSDGSNDWVDIPATAFVPLRPADLDEPSEQPGLSFSEEPCPLAAQVEECVEAVEVAEHAVQRTDVGSEDSARAERCARWNADDQAIAQTADYSEGRELG